MFRAKRVSGKQRHSSRKAVSLEPLFVSLNDGSFPLSENVQNSEELHRAIAAWTTYIQRLSSPCRMDAETAWLIARALLRRGVAYLLVQEPEAALHDLSQVITMQVGEVETNTAYLYRAQVYDALGQDAASFSDWTAMLEAIERASAHPQRFPKELAAQGYASRARLYCGQENYTQAIADCDRALAFNAACAEAYSIRRRAASLLLKWTEALADCTRAIELAGWPVHYYRRGLVHEQMGNYDQAFFDVERAYRQEPDNERFAKEYAQLLMLRLMRMGT